MSGIINLSTRLKTPNGITNDRTGYPIGDSSWEKQKAYAAAQKKAVIISLFVAAAAILAVVFVGRGILDRSLQSLKPHQVLIWEYKTFCGLGSGGRWVQKTITITVEMQKQRIKAEKLALSLIGTPLFLLSSIASWVALSTITYFGWKNEVEEIQNDLNSRIQGVMSDIRPNNEEEATALKQNAERLRANFESYGIDAEKAYNILTWASRIYTAERIKAILIKKLGNENAIENKINGFKADLERTENDFKLVARILSEKPSNESFKQLENFNNERNRLKEDIVKFEELFKWLRNPVMTPEAIKNIFDSFNVTNESPREMAHPGLPKGIYLV